MCALGAVDACFALFLAGVDGRRAVPAVLSLLATLVLVLAPFALAAMLTRLDVIEARLIPMCPAQPSNKSFECS